MVSWKKGQALVEFALILPLLLGVILAIIDGAFLVQGYLTVNHAAREAGRWAITYKPRQGDCLHHNANGAPISEPWPNCPLGGYPNPNESDEAYYRRRVQLIKRQATDAALGLRMDFVCNGDPEDSSTINSSECINDHLNDPGMFGVHVWGYQSHGSSLAYDRPGIEGLPVVVRVEYNVPLVIFGNLLPNAFVHVSSEVEMINEGIQVGLGNQPPPTGNPQTPTRSVGSGPTVTAEASPTSGPTPTNTPIPEYFIELTHVGTTAETAYNELPEGRAHVVEAHVYDSYGKDQAGSLVSFRTSAGSFSYSGTGANYIEAATGSNGRVQMTVYANEPETASLTAWLNFDGNDVHNPSYEPADTVTKVWQEPSAPYLLVSDHAPEPEAWIAVDVMNHPPEDNPYSLWWCPITGTLTTAQLAYPVNVASSTRNAEDVNVQVPANVAGTYRIESHIGAGGADPCGDNPVAVSAGIQVAEVLPDLQVSMRIAEGAKPSIGRPLTVTLYVTNTKPVAVTEVPFDVDVYADRESEPQVGQLGAQKQWVLNLGPSESMVLTETLVLYGAGGERNLWAQVDTTDYVDEGETGGEDNNVFGPLTFLAYDCPVIPSRTDDFNQGLKSIWSVRQFGDPDGSHTINGSGQLEITSDGNNIWSGSNDYYFIYQNVPYQNNFDVRLRVVRRPEPRTNQWAKMGLQIIEDVDDSRRPYVMHMVTRNKEPAAEQAAYRDNWNGGASRLSNSNNYQIDMPSWVRIVRQGNQYDFYDSSAESPTSEDWNHRGTHTTDNDLKYFGIAHASYNSGDFSTGIVDDFVFCSEPGTMTAPPEEEEPPPGLIQCTDLLQVTGFEGNPDTVAAYWRAGGYDAYQRSSAEFHRGSFAMRLHSSLGVYPCSANNYDPYLYQEVTLPPATEIFTQSTLVVDGYYLVAKSDMECSTGGPEADDELYLQVQDISGAPLTSRIPVTHGGTISNVWQSIAVDLSSDLNLLDHAGENVRIYWDADHDGDYNGTFFYIDDVEAQVCTEWPTPAPEAGTATFGGTITTLGEYNIPTILVGADVWAYAQGGEVYKTRSIHDGTYRFYNMSPGTYQIYAEAWVGGTLRLASTNVTVLADDNISTLNLLLQP
ncbi:MAG: TadE/TadG family type IV pilus assembly protein [Anaerolineae bacterium]